MMANFDNQRIEILESLRIMDTLPEKEYDTITELAATICDVPFAVVSLVGKDRQFFKSKVGLTDKGTPIDESICYQAIQNNDSIFIVEDTRTDPRFKYFPSVVGNPHLVYYAGVPLKATNGIPVGTLCVLDDKPKQLSKRQIHALKNLAYQVEKILTLRKSLFELEESHQELEVQTQKMQTIIEATKVGIWNWKIQPDQIVVDTRWAEMLGYTVADFSNTNIQQYIDLIHPVERKEIEAGIFGFLEGQEDYFKYRCRMAHKSGHFIWVENTGKIILRDPDGKPIQATGTHTDITEKTIREIHFKALSNNIPGAVFRYRKYTDGTDGMEVISGKAFELWGIQPKEVIGNVELIRINYNKEDLKSYKESIEESARMRSTWNHEWRYHHPDGSTRWHRGSGNPTVQPDGSFIWDCIITDVTKDVESKQQLMLAEEKSRNNEKLMLEAQHLAKMGSWKLNCLSNTMEWSEPLSKVYEIDYLPELDYFDSFFKFVIPEDKSRVLRLFEKARETGETFCIEFEILTDTGNRKYIEAMGYSQKNTEGTVHTLLGTAQDITQSKNFQNALEESNQRFKYVTKATFDVIWDWNLETGEVYFGENFTEHFGDISFPGLSMVHSVIQRLHPSEINEIVNKTKEHLDGNDTNWSHDHRFLKADGSFAFVTNKAIIIRDEHRKACRVIGAMQDITKRKEEEHRLRLLESVVTHTEDAVIITEAEPFEQPGPRILYVNESFTKMTGYSMEEVLGKNPRILQGEATNPEVLKNFGKALRNWQPAEITVLNYKKNREPFWVNIRVKPVANEVGFFTHWFSLQRDVTDKINEERQKKLLAEISQLLNKGYPTKDTLEKVLHEIVKFGDLLLAEVWLVSTDKKSISLNSYSPKNEETDIFYLEYAPIEDFYFGQGIPGNLWLEKKLHIWEDLDQLDFISRKNSFYKLGIYKIIGVPMFSNDEYIGCLTLGFKKEAYIPSFYPELFEALSSMLGNEIMRKKAETELDQLFLNAPDIIGIADRNGFFVKVNPAFCKMLGYTEKEITTAPFVNWLHPDDLVKTKKEYKDRLFNNTLSKGFINRYRTITGTYRWISWNISQLEEDNRYSFCYGRDITETIELRRLLDTANRMARIGGWEINLENRTVYLSEISFNIYELPEGKPIFLEELIHFFHPQRRNEFEAHLKLAIEQGLSWDIKLPVITTTGKEIWIRTIGQVEWQQDKVFRIFGSLQDIHSRKMAELAFEKEYTEKKEILESIGDVFFTIDRERVVTYWNKQAEKILRIPADQIIGHPLEKELEIKGLEQIHYQLATQDLATVSREIYLDKLGRWVEMTAYPTGKGHSVYLKDITYRKDAEEKVRLYNKRFVMVSKATNDAIWEWDMENDLLYQGDGFLNLFGYEPGYIQGNSLSIWQNRVHPEDWEKMDGYFEKVIKDKGLFKFSSEYRYIKSDGSFAFVIDRGVVVRNADGNAIRLIGATQDISDRKKYEESLMLLNKELANHAKELAISNEELEKFAFVASHDLQEPLRMVSSFLMQLDKKYGHLHDEKAKQYIHFAVDGAKRMRQIILDLLEYSRVGKEQEQPEYISLNEVVDEVKLMLHKLIEEKRAIIQTHHLPSVWAFRSSIFRVFQNLIGNAVKYSKESELAKIEINTKEDTDAWVISIKDNGIGIEASYFEKIFIIFQKLHPKDVYEGTGMGLSIVKKIVESFGGQIWLESTPQEGSTFYFSIPKKEN